MRIGEKLQQKLDDLEWARFRERVASFVEENDFPEVENRTDRLRLLERIEEARVLAFRWGLCTEFSVAMYFVLWTELDYDFMCNDEIRSYVFLDDTGVEERLEDLVYVFFDEEEERVLLQQLVDAGELDLATEMVRDVSFAENVSDGGM